MTYATHGRVGGDVARRSNLMKPIWIKSLVKI